jgi:ABC-2 type transport system ATP-binding protein
MRQRLHIARGILHDPEVVFLDEPTIGVDPVGARELRSMIAGLKASGKTVLLTTHYMFEADALCDRIAVVARGKIVADGTPRDLKQTVSDGVVVEIEVYGIEDAALEPLRAIPGVTSVGVEAQEQAQLVVVQAAAGSAPTHELLARLGGVTIGRVTTREPTLEDAYVALVSEPEHEGTPDRTPEPAAA